MKHYGVPLVTNNTLVARSIVGKRKIGLNETLAKASHRVYDARHLVIH